MTADELAVRDAMLKDAHVQVRCAPEEKRAWVERAGGKRQLSAWARRVLNRECVDPRPPMPDTQSVEDADEPGGTRVEYDP